MKKIILAALLLVATTAQAQVYKCTEGGKIVYTQIPCEAWEPEMDLKVYQPSEEDRLRAEAAALRDRAGVIRSNLDLEERKREARAETQARQAQADALQRKCDEINSRIERLEARADKWQTPVFRHEDRYEVEQLKKRQFSECFGR